MPIIVVARYPAGMVVTGVAPPLSNRRLIRWGARRPPSRSPSQLGNSLLVESPTTSGQRIGQSLLVLCPLLLVTPDISLPKPIVGDSGLPSSIFRRLSGAEQEAVLDLMQDDPQGKAQLSI